MIPAARLRIPAGRLRIPAGRLRIPAGRLRIPAGRLRIPAGRLRFWHLRLLLVVLVVVLPLLALVERPQLLGQDQPVRAEAKPSSLDFVPAETAFYFATSNHRQIWQAVTESRAYAALKETPAGRKMRKAYRKGLSRGWDQFGENPLRYYLEGYANSLDSMQGKVILPYLERLLVNELFVYADTRTVNCFNTLAAYYDELNTTIRDSAKSEDSPEIWGLIEAVGKKHLSKLEVPTIVIGSIAEEPEVFVGFLELMHSSVKQLIAENPAESQLLADALRYQKGADTGGGTTAGEQIAWFGFEFAGDELPWDNLTLVDPDLTELIEAFQPLFAGKRFAFAFAVTGDAVFLTLGPSFDHLRQLGSGPLLIDQPLLEPLREAREAGQAICFARFQSAEFARLTQASWEDLAKGAANLFAQVLAAAQSELMSEVEMVELMESFRQEVRQFAVEMSAFEIAPGAALSYGQLTAEGIEGFAYHYDQPAENGADQPLQLPAHLATPPLLAMFTRDQSTAEQWRVVGNYADRFLNGLEKYGPLLAEDLERAEISAIVLEQLAPLLRGLAQTTFGGLLPQLAGEEWGLVIDLSVARSSWHQAMPPAATPLSLPGAVLLLSHHDPAAVKQVGEQYLAIARQALEDLKELGNGEIPESLDIPDPDRESLGTGMQYSFSLPGELGLSPDWLPHAVVGERLLAIGYFPEQTVRLLAAGGENERATKVNGKLFGPAAEPGTASGLMLLDNRQLASAVEAWTYYGLDQAAAAGKSLGLDPAAESAELNLSAEEVRATLAAAFDFYRCFIGYSSRTYRSGNTRVQHFLWQFSDLDR